MSDFYDELVSGKQKRETLGLNKRFNIDIVKNNENINKNFTKKIKKLISSDSIVLDFGCGVGTFSFLAAPYAKKIIATDSSKEFIKLMKKNNSYSNIEVQFADDFYNKNYQNFFDVIMIVDVLHHLNNDLDRILSDIYKMLKKNGVLIIYEPNKLNPIIYLMHLIDSNERFLLKLGRPGIYKKILGSNYNLDITYNGIVIGPTSIFWKLVSNFLNHKLVYKLIGFLNPKILIIAEKK